jgi:hypothetical protein
MQVQYTTNIIIILPYIQYVMYLHTYTKLQTLNRLNPLMLTVSPTTLRTILEQLGTEHDYQVWQWHKYHIQKLEELCTVSSL